MYPIGSMYGMYYIYTFACIVYIYTHEWLICMVNVGKPFMDPMDLR